MYYFLIYIYFLKSAYHFFLCEATINKFIRTSQIFKKAYENGKSCNIFVNYDKFCIIYGIAIIIACLVFSHFWTKNTISR